MSMYEIALANENSIEELHLIDKINENKRISRSKRSISKRLELAENNDCALEDE